MDRASRRKKRQAKAKVQGEIEEGQNKLEIVLLEEIAEEWSQKAGRYSGCAFSPKRRSQAD